MNNNYLKDLAVFHNELVLFIVRTEVEQQGCFKEIPYYDKYHHCCDNLKVVKFTPDESTVMLADVRDYFLWITIKEMESTNPLNAKTIMEMMLGAAGFCEEIGDKFHAAFFFTLTNILQLKFQLKVTGGPLEEMEQQQLSYDAFKTSWETTLEKLGLEEPSDK